MKSKTQVSQSTPQSTDGDGTSVARTYVTGIPLSHIAEHPAIEGLPRWASDSEELALLAEDIGAHGLMQPLILAEIPESDGSGYWLLDGRHRLAACRLAKLESVEAIIRPEEDAADVILGSLSHRRHFSKGALAYLSYPVIEGLQSHGGWRGNQHQKLAKCTECTLPPVEEVAARLGFSRRVFFQARDLHRLFAKNSLLRERWEPAILSGEIGLGAVIAGIAGQEATAGKKRQDRTDDQLLFDGFDSITMRLGSYWSRLGERDRKLVTARAVEAVCVWPEDVRQQIAAALGALAPKKGGRAQ